MVKIPKHNNLPLAGLGVRALREAERDDVVYGASKRCVLFIHGGVRYMAKACLSVHSDTVLMEIGMQLSGEIPLAWIQPYVAWTVPSVPVPQCRRGTIVAVQRALLTEEAALAQAEAPWDEKHCPIGDTDGEVNPNVGVDNHGMLKCYDWEGDSRYYNVQKDCGTYITLTPTDDPRNNFT